MRVGPRNNERASRLRQVDSDCGIAFEKKAEGSTEATAEADNVAAKILGFSKEEARIRRSVLKPPQKNSEAIYKILNQEYPLERKTWEKAIKDAKDASQSSTKGTVKRAVRNLADSASFGVTKIASHATKNVAVKKKIKVELEDLKGIEGFDDIKPLLINEQHFNRNTTKVETYVNTLLEFEDKITDPDSKKKFQRLRTMKMLQIILRRKKDFQKRESLTSAATGGVNVVASTVGLGASTAANMASKGVGKVWKGVHDGREGKYQRYLDEVEELPTGPRKGMIKCLCHDGQSGFKELLEQRLMDKDTEIVGQIGETYIAKILAESPESIAAEKKYDM
ncbi:hypothetical protein DID78_06800 [Candidatus Marinamargulisbacteria bacterium SCGC AG-343-D04]|nr:hypothetical protein DID78_06800 [Candidatus Marinamargulisbacteria bacterium SCGC AG-343-D04]